MIHARRSGSVAAAAAVVLFAGPALAQVEPSEPPGPPVPIEPPQPAPTEAAPGAPAEAYPAPIVAPAEAPPVLPAGPPLEVVRRYRAGRVVAGTGTLISLIGSGLTLTSWIAAPFVDTKQDPWPIALGYAGTGATGLGVILSATGLGLQHSALAKVGADPGRGLYATGTVFGVLGLLTMGGSYFLNATRYVYDHPSEQDKRLAVNYGTIAASAVLLTLSGILFVSDSARLGRAYKRLTTF